MRDKGNEWPAIPVIADRNSPKDKQIQTLHFNLVWYMKQGFETPDHFAIRELIYIRGYENRKLKTVVYSDAKNNLANWITNGKRIELISQLSVELQRLMIKNTNHGDMTDIFTNIWDPESIGSLYDKNTYSLIAKKSGCRTRDTLFISGSPAPVKAANDAGCMTYIVISHPHQQFGASIRSQDVYDLRRVRMFDEIRWKGLTPASVPAAPVSNVNPKPSRVRRDRRKQVK